MKKSIGIFSILIIISIIFFNINLSSNSKTGANVDIADLIATNVANAEVGQNGCFYTSYWLDECAIPPYVPKPLCQPSYMYLCNN